MDYKQKYEDALERAKNYHKGHTVDVNLQAAMEYVFSELKEGEDEEARNYIINHFKSHLDDCNSFISDSFIPLFSAAEIKMLKASIAWVEKQGKIVDEYEDKLDRCACESFYKGYKAALEKQGEQKPINKVELKFKVGDIIILNGDITNKGEYEIFKILKVCSSWYDVENMYDGKQTMISFAQEYTCRLWTIQDAKKGDILQANKCTLIFDSLTKDIDGNTVISSWYYCDTKTFYGMGTCKPDLWTIEGVVPATKEECDLLFSKMKEAGYEWNAEKKELKKLEQKHTEWSEDDEKRCISAIEHLENSISDTPSSLRPYVRQDIAWLESLKQRMKGE